MTKTKKKKPNEIYHTKRPDRARITDGGHYLFWSPSRLFIKLMYTSTPAASCVVRLFPPATSIRPLFAVIGRFTSSGKKKYAIFFFFSLHRDTFPPLQYRIFFLFLSPGPLIVPQRLRIARLPNYAPVLILVRKNIMY